MRIHRHVLQIFLLINTAAHVHASTIVAANTDAAAVLVEREEEIDFTTTYATEYHSKERRLQAIPSSSPTWSPSALPTFSPSDVPSDVPSNSPSNSPSFVPSDIPSVSPSFIPSEDPTALPSTTPSVVPSVSPTYLPSPVPSTTPSINPSYFPSYLPSSSPSDPRPAPSGGPSVSTKPSGPTHGPSPAPDPCDTYSCAHGGTCGLDEFNMPNCDCLPGYPGDHCDAGDVACGSYRCANGGLCKAMTPVSGTGANDSGYDAYCACAAGYYGKHCDTKLADCDLACQNGGVCQVNTAKNEPYCSCSVNFVGDACEQPRIRCGLSYCYNGGKCIFTGSESVCDCSYANFNFTEWEGSKCSDESEGSSGGLSSAGAALIAISVILFSAFGVFVYRKRRPKASAHPPDDLVMHTVDGNTSGGGIVVDGEDKEMI